MCSQRRKGGGPTEEEEEESESEEEGGKGRGAQFATRPVGTMPSSSSEEEDEDEDEEEEEEEVGDVSSQVQPFEWVGSGVCVYNSSSES